MDGDGARNGAGDGVVVVRFCTDMQIRRDQHGLRSDYHHLTCHSADLLPFKMLAAGRRDLIAFPAAPFPPASTGLAMRSACEQMFGCARAVGFSTILPLRATFIKAVNAAIASTT